MAIGSQVVLRAVEDRVLATDDATRRRFSEVIRRLGRAHGLYAWGLADSHGHAALLADERSVGRFVHDVRPALGAALGVTLAPAVIHPIRDLWHARSLLRYVHRQDAEHGVCADPRREATSLPDLFGLRPDGLWVAQRIRVELPRVRREELLEHWGLAELEEAFDLSLLGDAAAAVVDRVSLAGRDEALVTVRRAAAHVAEGESPEAVAATLGISPRSLRRLRAEPPDPAFLRAIRLQLGLRLALAPTETLFFRERVVRYGARSELGF